jgi:FtsH-binding integral membrane protein
MGSLYIVLLRILFSVVLAFLISLVFFKGSIIKILGLAAIMFVLAYLFEFTRKRDKKGGERGTHSL